MTNFVFSSVLLLLFCFATLTALPSTTTTTFINAQSSSTSSNLIDGSALTSNVCYSASSNLRRDQISVLNRPTASITVVRLAPGPKTTISCIDLIEVQTGPTTPSDFCTSKASLTLCSGPLGSSSNQHTDCTAITSFYTTPRAVITAGSVNDDDKEWSVKYDGSEYNTFCFPRNVQIVVYSVIEGSSEGSVALLVIMIILCVAVIATTAIYFWYQQTRQVAKAEFDNAVNVMPTGRRQQNFPGDDDNNDEIYDEDGNRVTGNDDNDAERIDVDDDNNGDQPPGLPNNQQGDRGIDEMLEMEERQGNLSPRSGGAAGKSRNKNYIVDDGPQIFSSGPVASIYGSDIQQDILSIGRTEHGRRSLNNNNQQQQRQPSANPPPSAYRVLPDVNTCPLPPLNQQNIERLSSRSQQQHQQRVEPSQSQASYQNGNNNNNQNDDDGDSQKVTICADCGVNVDADDCPQTCEVTGKAHF